MILPCVSLSVSATAPEESVTTFAVTARSFIWAVVVAAVPSIAAAPLPITSSRRVKPLSSSWLTNFHFGTQLHTTQFPVQRERGRPPCLLNQFGVYSLYTEPVVTPDAADRNPSSHVRNVSYSTRCRMYLFDIVRNNQPAYRGTLLTDPT